MKALRTFGFSDERVGGGYTNSGIKLKYICLSCNAEFNGSKCRKCGSKMKKPIF
jgi:rRNA maturation endonuclease Nob1